MCPREEGQNQCLSIIHKDQVFKCSPQKRTVRHFKRRHTHLNHCDYSVHVRTNEKAERPVVVVGCLDSPGRSSSSGRLHTLSPSSQTPCPPSALWSNWWNDWKWCWLSDKQRGPRDTTPWDPQRCFSGRESSMQDEHDGSGRKRPFLLCVAQIWWISSSN